MELGPVMAHGVEAAWVANARKEKGDRAERSALSWLRLDGFPWAERTRAGYERDAGDIHLIPGGSVIAQVKDQKTPRWTEWLDQLREQIAQARAQHGFLLVKRTGKPIPGEWLAVMPLSAFTALLRQAGYGGHDQGAPNNPNVSRAGETLADTLDSVLRAHLPGEPGHDARLDDDQDQKPDRM